MKAAAAFAPNLLVHQLILPGGAEWTPGGGGWIFLQTCGGFGYWQQAGEVWELSESSTLVLMGEPSGTLRASRLGELSVAYFRLEPSKLTGLLSLQDQHSLQKAAALEPAGLRILGPADPLSLRFKGLCQGSNSASLRTRLLLIQLFIDSFNGELEVGKPESAPELDGRGRLRQFLNQTVAAELADLSLADLATRMHCNPRHVSRLFRQEVGSSFREKQTELRLVKACELLSSSNAKVVDVALNSGYQSPSLFNLIFKKHFGLSPGKWREQQGARHRRRPRLIRAFQA